MSSESVKGQLTKGQLTKGQLTKGQLTKGQLTKGRGSVSNTESRYLQTRTVSVDNGWGGSTDATDASNPPPTEWFKDRTKRLITSNRSDDIPFNQSINPYKGCEHGCIYCFARPTHAFLDLSPGLDFETKIFYKSDPRAHLEAELGRKGYQCQVIAMGTNTDPYQPAERTLKVTREILTTLLAHKHPVSIVTKSKLILRDIEILQELAALHLVHVNVSVTTLSNDLKTKLEPRTASPAARLRTIGELRAAGVPVGAMLAPIIPFINDHEIEALVNASAEAGASVLRYILLRLPLEVADLFTQWLQTHFPLKTKRVLAAISDARGGRLYNSAWHTRMVGEGPIAELIAGRFARALRGVGLHNAEHPPLATNLFLAPQASAAPQLDLFQAPPDSL